MNAIGLKKNRSQTGAVFAEFALVLPVLFIFFVGLLELGRLFSSVSWLSQISYNAVLAAAEVENPDTSEAHDAAYARMRRLQDHYIEEKGTYNFPVSLADQSVVTNYDSRNNIVTLRMSGKIHRIIDAFIPESVMPLNFNVNVAAPYFGSGIPEDLPNANRFAQPSEDLSFVGGGTGTVGGIASSGPLDPEEGPLDY